MDIRHLEEFCVLVQEASYSSAAKKLFITQSALSQRIRKMEAELGFPLLVHGASPMQLTDVGEYYYAKVLSFVEQYRALEDSCREAYGRQSRTVRVANLKAETSACQRFCREVGDVYEGHVTLVPKSDFLSSNEFEALDQMDFSFTFAPEGDPHWFDDVDGGVYGFVPLEPEPLGVVTSKSCDLCKRSRVRASDLSAYELVLVNTPYFLRCENAIRRVVRDSGAEPEIISGTDSSQLKILSLSPRHIAVMFRRGITSFEQDSEYSVLRLCDVDLRLMPYAVYRRDNPNPAVRQLADAISASRAI